MTLAQLFASLVAPLRWLVNHQHARQREIDLQILWPACVENASDLNHAKAAFAFHAFHDKAWLVLGEDEIARRIDGLTR